MASIFKKDKDREEIVWLNKSLKIYKKALDIAIKYGNKKKEEEYKKEIDKITEQLNLLQINENNNYKLKPLS